MTMPGGALAGAVNPVDDLVFAIALMEFDREPKLLADAAAVGFDVGQRLASIDFWLALAEEIEIGAVQDNDDRIQRNFPLPQVIARSEATWRTRGRRAPNDSWIASLRSQ